MTQVNQYHLSACPYIYPNYFLYTLQPGDMSNLISTPSLNIPFASCPLILRYIIALLIYFIVKFLYQST